MGKTVRVWSGSRRGGDAFKKKLRRERRQNLKQSIRNCDDNTIGNLISNNKAGWDLHRKSVSTSLRAKAKSIERTEKKTLPVNFNVKIYPSDSGKNLVVRHIDRDMKGNDYNYQTITNMNTIMI